MHFPPQFHQCCCVAPSPNVLNTIRNKIKADELTINDMLFRSTATRMAVERPIRRTGLNDGVFYPEDNLPAGLEGAMAVKLSVSTRRRKTIGTFNTLVILVDFDDNEGEREACDFNELLFSSDSYMTGSLRDYYHEVSFGKLEVTGHVTGWHRMPHPYSYYVNGESGMSSNFPENSQGLAEDALSIAAQQLDMRSFDADGDGFIDGLFIVYAGSGAESTEDADLRRQRMWSHKAVLKQPKELGGVRAYAYSVEPEDGAMGVFAHEFGHILGLPDLYDRTNHSAGAGNWCLMASGSWGGLGHRPTHPCAWAKAAMGWIEPINVASPGIIQLPPVEISPVIYRLWKASEAGREYFLLENRQKLAFDQYLPGSGLLVWHIDDGQPDNDDPRHYRVGLEQADGRRDLERGQNDGDFSDPYPCPSGNRAFDDQSRPNSRDYFGDPTNVAVKNISQLPPHDISCDVSV